MSQSGESQTTPATVLPPPARALGAPPPSPAALQASDFTAYPANARALAIEHLPLLRTIPLPLLPVLLREIASYDYKFPVERQRLQEQLSWLMRLAPAQHDALLAPFAALRFSAALARMNWIHDPSAYMEQLSAELWSNGTMAAFRAASGAYADNFNGAVPQSLPTRPRLCVVVLDESLRASDGQGASFRRLRHRGVLLTGIEASEGFAGLLQRVRMRSTAPETRAAAYRHWYVDGGDLEPVANTVATTSYAGLEPVRRKLLARAQSVFHQERSGPEELRSLMAQLKPEDVGLPATIDPVLAHFELALMAEGSGTQVFSTTFVQWAAREVLRRAEPETLLLRFRARQRQQGMNELMTGSASLGPDLPGSLIDAEQGAFYTWLNLRRLPGAEQALFVAWQQGSTQAVALGPGLAAGTSAAEHKPLHDLIDQLT